MATADFPGNSQRPRRALPQGEPAPERPEKGKIEKVVEGEVIFRKKTLGKRFRDFFIAEDGVTVRQYVIEDIVRPALRDLLFDAALGGLERTFYRDGRPVGRGLRGRGIGGLGLPGGGIRYDLASRGPAGRGDDPRPQLSRRARATHDFEQIIMPSRADAEAVLTGLFDILEQYNEVKVLDLYELIGYSSNFTDDRYGWTDLRGSSVHRTRQGGYVLELPPTQVLDR
jgi:hypothetical protein